MSLSLSGRGLANVSSLSFPHDFTFILSGAHYPCNRFCAAFLSPAVSRTLKTDPFVSSFTLDLPDPTHSFPDVMRLLSGSSVPITPANVTFISQVGRHLDNRELITCSRAVTDSPPTLTNALELASVRFSLGLRLDSVTTFIASKFMDFNRASLQSLHPRLLESVLLSPSLVVESEGWLLDFAISTVAADDRYRPLLGCVAADLLSEADLQRFLALVTADDLTPALWESLCRRLALSPARAPTPGTRYPRAWETYAMAGDPLDGIMQHLVRTYGLQKFEVRASSFADHALRVLSPDPDARWQSANVRDSWISFDFRDLRIRLSGYSIKTYKAQAGSSGWHLRSWRLLGSNDDAVWTLIDNKTECEDLNGTYRIGTWQVDGKEWFRFLKVQVADVNHAGTWAMTIGSIEFFGDVMGEVPVVAK